MPVTLPRNDTQDEQISITLKLDAKLYQSFLEKAEKAGVAIEPYLSGTLAIVLGCRMFTEVHSCSPRLCPAAHSQNEAVKQPLSVPVQIFDEGPAQSKRK